MSLFSPCDTDDEASDMSNVLIDFFQTLRRLKIIGRKEYDKAYATIDEQWWERIDEIEREKEILKAEATYDEIRGA